MAPLNDAAERGDLAEVERLLRSGVDIFEKNEDGRTCLHFASAKGHVEVVKLLVEKGGERLLMVQEEGFFFGGFTCLHSASLEGHVEVVKLLVEKGGEMLLMVQEEDGRTCLHSASQEGHVEVVKLLVEKGGERLLMVQTKSGRTCLHWASAKGHLEVVKLLVEKGGERLLMVQEEDGHSCLGNLVRDSAGVFFGEEEVSEDDKLVIVKVLLEAGDEEIVAEAKERYMGHHWVARAVEWYEGRQVEAKLLAFCMGGHHRLGSLDGCVVGTVIHQELIRETVRDELWGLVGRELAALSEQAALSE